MAINGQSKKLGCSDVIVNPDDCGTPTDGCWIELPRNHTARKNRSEDHINHGYNHRILLFSVSSQKGTHLNDNDSDDSTGGWIPFWSGDSSDQKTGSQIKLEQISWKIGRLEANISYNQAAT